MKYLLIIAVAMTMAVSSAVAGCGKKVASIGKLDGVDASTKAITIAVAHSSDPGQVKAKKAKLTLTPDTKIIVDGKINEHKIADLVGKDISVVSEHGKVDYVIALVGKS